MARADLRLLRPWGVLKLIPYKILQLRRGLKADLGTLSVGEPGFCTDTHELFIGTATGNVKINIDYSANGADWQGTPPTTMQAAMDRVVHAVKILLGGAIP